MPHSIVRCGSEENIPILLLNPPFSDDNHRIICTDFLYLNSSNGVVCYHIDFISLGSKRDLYRGKKFLGVGRKVDITEWGGGVKILPWL